MARAWRCARWGPTWRAGRSRRNRRCGGPTRSNRLRCGIGCAANIRRLSPGRGWPRFRRRSRWNARRGTAAAWGDETGLRADDVRGRSDAPRGKTPVVRPNQRRISLGLISAVSNRGELRWMVLDGAIKALMLIDFLQRLIRDARRKVFLILDRLPVHRAAVVREWLARHTRQIEVFYLPSYSPELNPDEGLNADLKQNVLRKAPMRSKQALKQATISPMR